MELINYSDKFLVFYDAYMAGGGLISPPISIPSGGGDVFSGNNGGWAGFGVYGVLAWEIGNTDHMLVIYVLVPANRDLSSNYLGFGVFKTQSLTDSAFTIYNYFYYGTGKKNTQYVTRDFYNNVSPLQLSQNKDYFIQGVMTDGGYSKIEV